MKSKFISTAICYQLFFYLVPFQQVDAQVLEPDSLALIASNINTNGFVAAGFETGDSYRVEGNDNDGRG